MIALDLDGTLLTTDKRISSRTRSVMEECKKRGIQIVPSTGRALGAVPGEILELPGVRYGIFTNGASVWDMAQNASIAEQCIEWQTALKTVQILRNYPLIYDMYVAGNGICERHFLSVLEDFGLSPENCRFIRETRRTVEDLTDFLKETRSPVQKMNLTFRDKAVKAEVRRALEQLEGLMVTSSLPWNLELNAAGTTKGSGLECLRLHLGLAKEETMACGDGENDLPMIKTAGIGVAMANGAPFIKAQADAVTLTNDRDGVAAAIERYALGTT